MAEIDVRRADTRPHTDLGWLDSRHSFSFGNHHDPSNSGHGLLLVSNDDRVRAGTGFGTHSHRDMEIITWVLSGQVEHQDSEGNHGVLYPGLAQRMSAGSGISHSEHNPSPIEDAHFVQMWVLPDTEGVQPGYEQLDVNRELEPGGLHLVASGRHREGVISIHQRDAELWIGRLAGDEEAIVPEGSHVHVFVALGSGVLDGAGELTAGDAARLTDAGPRRLIAGPVGAEVLIWVTA